MAVPAVGTKGFQLSLRGIRNEFQTSNYYGSLSFTNIGLTSLSTGGYGTINTANSSKPNGIVPHKTSEFAGYDHDLVTLTAESGIGGPWDSGKQACSQGIYPTTTWYFDGDEEGSVSGDNVYEDSAGTTAADDGTYRRGANFITVSSGAITGIGSCFR